MLIVLLIKVSLPCYNNNILSAKIWIVMAKLNSRERLLSHQINQDDLAKVVKQIREKIRKSSSQPNVSIERQIELLEQLAQFDFGRFLLINRGINGYWTHYMLTHPWFGRKNGKNNRGEELNPLETFILDRAPTTLATQQRFEIFLKENQRSVADGAVLACIPSGLMGELLYLNFDEIDNISLVGIDYDNETLKDAGWLAHDKGLAQWIQVQQSDAWHLNTHNNFDLISSNGLNIYEPNDTQVTELYRQFYLALKPGGKLVTSFLTPPPVLTKNCEWLMDEIKIEDLSLQKILFSNILESKWQCFRSSNQTEEQLKSVGFNNIKFLYDKAHMFPTVTAIK